MRPALRPSRSSRKSWRWAARTSPSPRRPPSEPPPWPARPWLWSASIDKVSGALARLGTASKALSTHNTFVGKLSDALEAGVGNLVDADLAKESATLQALQTKQQLGVQALSIANQSTSVLVSLFRG
jgi:hypothetical protein